MQNLNLAEHSISFDSNPSDNVVPSALSYYFEGNNTFIRLNDVNQNNIFNIKLIGNIALENSDFVF